MKRHAMEVEWEVVNRPAAGAQAIATRAARASWRHIITHATFTIASGGVPVAQALLAQILDVSTGNELWSGYFGIQGLAGWGDRIVLQFEGIDDATDGGAVTIQFANGVAAIFESVLMRGYDQQVTP